MEAVQPKVLINLANVHSGGALQVAASFIEELARLPVWQFPLSLLISTEVMASLTRQGTDTTRFASVAVKDVHGFPTLWSGLGAIFKSFDAVFTVFGPLYVWPQPKLSIVGFAQPWIIYPINEISQSLPFHRRWARRAFYEAKTLFFCLADSLVVELPHVRNGLIEKGIKSGDRIYIAENCPSSLFWTPSRWAAVKVEQGTGAFRIGIPSRDYSHKNLNILPALKGRLHENFNMDVDFYVTLTSKEWNSKSTQFREAVINCGPLEINQVPSFYEQMTGVIFPSFLECFSATPVEALAVAKPLFASDRHFVREVCGDVPFYFEPTDVGSIAQCIADGLREPEEAMNSRLARGQAKVRDSFSASRRAEQYLTILGQELNEARAARR
jgi:glycosyltransferase involved in cell wall biosynthesis